MSALPPKIRVLVVDDSALARRSISDALSRDPAIAVVGFAADPYIARERILELEPDVITLDMEMPRMDGLTFLRILQEHHPVPVVVVSSLTQAGSELALQALEAGAIEVLAKPDGSASIGEIARQLIYGVKAAARSQGRAARALKVAAPMAPTALAYAGDATHQRPQLPANVPPIVVVQHIPANFSRIMAAHLDALCRFTVREASDGEELRSGVCLIAPGGFHAVISATGRGYRVRLTQTPPVHYCRPSVDVLFRSGAEAAGPNVVAALLTGMGSDGARGLQLLRSRGARTLAEAEESCVVFGMPQAAIKLGAAEQVVPLQRMPQAILRALTEAPPR